MRKTTLVPLSAAVAASLACGVLTGCSSSAPRQADARQDAAGTAAQPQDSTVRTASRPKGLIPGIDVSAYQPKINWASVKARGNKFAYIKATEGVRYVSSTFASQYAAARKAGLAHGAYHFATPNTASGKRQADYLIAHGGGGKADGHTLPGVLDIEKNPYGKNKCYGLSHAKMVTWIGAFLNEYHARTGRRAVINTFKDWWIDCTGNSKVFSAKDRLWVNDHKATAHKIPVPSAWSSYTIWQWTDKGVYGDEDYVKSATVYRKLLAE